MLSDAEIYFVEQLTQVQRVNNQQYNQSADVYIQRNPIPSVEKSCILTSNNTVISCHLKKQLQEELENPRITINLEYSSDECVQLVALLSRYLEASQQTLFVDVINEGPQFGTLLALACNILLETKLEIKTVAKIGSNWVADPNDVEAMSASCKLFVVKNESKVVGMRAYGKIVEDFQQGIKLAVDYE
ncbi:PNPase/RNase_PH domain superfamily [Hexamita inflata]|uniref:PNPase/RNase PH domain superfamily n=1 Tax=Hexamita inflata TaxID=28002 RepID=A0AA86P7N5_9EUKA|nr:PNPase/RNase PH domain superfamily [Hexamita inflata]